jgi:hypothetical protein
MGTPAQRSRFGDRSPRQLPVRGPQRIERQQVLHIRQYQLLMLLFVVKTKLDRVEQRASRAALQQIEHSPVDVRTIFANLVEPRP